MAMLGRFFHFVCDFCPPEKPTEIHRLGFGLPPGWKWTPANNLQKTPLRHVCPVCIEAGRHGELPLVDSGKLSPVS